MFRPVVALFLVVSFASAFAPSANELTLPRTGGVSLAMGLILYGSQGSRSPLVNWAANELKLELEMGDLAENPHPFGQIPCLTNDDGVVLFESGAILVYFLSLATDPLSESKKASVLSWVAWANASLDPICFLETPNGKVYDTGLRQPNKRIDRLDEILGKQDYLVDGGFTVADVAVASYLLYVLQFFPDIDLSRWPNIVRYMLDCALRPEYASAFGENIQNYLVEALRDMGKSKKMFGMF